MMAVIRVRSAVSDAGSSITSRLLSALGVSRGGPRQPVTPRISGVMCRGPRVPPATARLLPIGQNRP
jgi:hypothetical protein